MVRDGWAAGGCGIRGNCGGKGTREMASINAVAILERGPVLLDRGSVRSRR